MGESKMAERTPAREKRVYLDHNASSPMRPEAVAAMRDTLEADLGNPSSLHAEGRAARAVVEEARESVAALAGVASSALAFTSGGSEAIEAAVRGVCDRAPANIRRIVVSSVEHSAVLEAVRAQEARGFTVKYVPCDGDGRVDPHHYRDEIGMGRTTALVVLQWANNETGVLQPVDEVGAICRERKVPFLVDAAQVAGRMPMDPGEVRADFVAVSGHKLGGPQGSGALSIREGFVLAPLIHGGAQEKRRRGGTPAVACIAGFGAAAAAAREKMKRESTRLLRLRARIETRLHENFPGVRIHGQGSARLSNTVSFALDGVSGEMLVVALDLAGFSVSTGSACASGAVEPSHVIRAMGYDEAEARGAVRVSLGWNTTQKEVDRFLGTLPGVVERVRAGHDARLEP
jgi:cysteine desulfurase